MHHVIGCLQKDVETRYAKHERRLASVKASLALTTPLRLAFMDKRLSKNYHRSRHQAQLIHENLKLLRALEKIHCRDPAACIGGNSQGTSKTGKSISCRGSSDVPGSTSWSKQRAKKLNQLLARRRDVKAAAVARENHKMVKVRFAK